jgi:TRAP-type C4-dicarboxylate transport system permease small subunit
MTERIGAGYSTDLGYSPFVTAGNTPRMLRLISAVPRFAVTALIILAIVNLLVGVILRYFVGAITNWLDIDPVPFTWVEEVGELSLAWLTLIGAAIGIRSRSHFSLPVFMHRLPAAAQLWIHRFNHALISGVGLLVAWYGVKLCLLNRALTTPGLEINLAWLYASAVVGGLLIAIFGFAAMISPLPQGDPQH